MPWPTSASRLPDGQLALGGVPISSLTERWGTPLYVFDEETLRTRARRFRATFSKVYGRSRIVYAAKAYLSPALVAILWREGIGLDVVSGGEIYAGLAAGVAAEGMIFHGNNKTEDELRQALDVGLGLIAIDNEWEIDLLVKLTAGRAGRQPVLIRLNPGIEVETHDKLRTGALDSKFGFPVPTGAAADAVARVVAVPGLELVGYHAHVGSQIFDACLVGATVDAMLAFAAEMRERHGVLPRVISPGGGFGMADDATGDDVSIDAWASAAVRSLTSACERHRLPLPELVVEPGRAIVGPAAVALYRVGSRTEIPGVRTYVSVDGGMADNIRPTLYGARYTAELANRQGTGPEETVTIAGKYCEAGDVLIEGISLPRLQAGDVLAVPMAGAYCLAMASNYNLAPRPAVVLVSNGQARLIRRRETYDDMLVAEVLPERRTVWRPVTETIDEVGAQVAAASDHIVA